MLRAFVLVVSLAFVGPAEAADHVLVTVNGGKVFLPTPQGMESVNPEEYRRTHPDVVSPPKTRLLAFFVPRGAAQKQTADHYAFVQINDPTVTVPPGGIAKLAGSMRTLMVKLESHAVAKSSRAFAEAKDRISAYYGVKGLTIRAKGITLHRSLLESPALIAYSLYAEYEIEFDGKTEIVFRPCVMGISNLNGVSVYFYKFGLVGASADDPAFVATSKQWANAVLTGNALPAK